MIIHEPPLENTIVLKCVRRLLQTLETSESDVNRGETAGDGKIGRVRVEGARKTWVLSVQSGARLSVGGGGAPFRFCQTLHESLPASCFLGFVIR